jgi:hypothetical protein
VSGSECAVILCHSNSEPMGSGNLYVLSSSLVAVGFTCTSFLSIALIHHIALVPPTSPLLPHCRHIHFSPSSSSSLFGCSHHVYCWSSDSLQGCRCLGSKATSWYDGDESIKSLVCCRRVRLTVVLTCCTDTIGYLLAIEDIEVGVPRVRCVCIVQR